LPVSFPVQIIYRSLSYRIVFYLLFSLSAWTVLRACFRIAEHIVLAFLFI